MCRAPPCARDHPPALAAPTLQGLSSDALHGSSGGGAPIFAGEEELFAFARVLSRLTEMGTVAYASKARAFGLAHAQAHSQAPVTPAPAPAPAQGQAHAEADC